MRSNELHLKGPNGAAAYAQPKVTWVADRFVRLTGQLEQWCVICVCVVDKKFDSFGQPVPAVSTFLPLQEGNQIATAQFLAVFLAQTNEKSRN